MQATYISNACFTMYFEVCFEKRRQISHLTYQKQSQFEKRRMFTARKTKKMQTKYEVIARFAMCFEVSLEKRRQILHTTYQK